MQKDIVKNRLIHYLAEDKIRISNARNNLEIQDLYKKYCLEYENLSEIDNLVDKLFDIEKDEQNITNRDSYVIRKRLGVYDHGKEQTYIEIAKNMGYSASYAREHFNKLIIVLRKMVECYIVVKDKNKDDIVNTIIYELNLPLNVLNSLYYGGIRCVNDIILLDKTSLLNIKGISLRIYDIIKKLIHSMGLKFIDEESNLETDSKITNDDVLKDKIEEQILEIERLNKARKLMNDIYQKQVLLIEMYKNEIANERVKQEEIINEILKLNAMLNGIVNDKISTLTYSPSKEDNN